MNNIENKLFIVFNKMMRSEIPGWEQADVNEVPRRQKMTNYCMLGERRYGGKYWFLSLCRKSKGIGEMSIDITLSNSLNRSILDAPQNINVNGEISIGTIPIHIYMGKQNYSWVLTDFETANGYRLPYDHWRPDDFSDQSKIVEDAAVNMIQTLKSDVFVKITG